MQFRLLGPLEVADVHGPVRIIPGKESALLALLLINARYILAADQIVEELWGAAAPSNARKQVQIHVSRLRKALGAEWIVTTPGGYRLDAEDDEIDVRRFESAAQGGRLREALAEWRGDALADFVTPLSPRPRRDVWKSYAISLVQSLSTRPLPEAMRTLSSRSSRRRFKGIHFTSVHAAN